MIKVTANRLHLPDKRIVVHFSSEVTDVDLDTLPTVCLSRNKPGSCNFRVDMLAEHDGHSPAHKTIEEANAYIERVLTDIQAGLKIDLESEKVDMKVLLASPFGNLPMGGTIKEN